MKPKEKNRTYECVKALSRRMHGQQPKSAAKSKAVHKSRSSAGKKSSFSSILRASLSGSYVLRFLAIFVAVLLMSVAPAYAAQQPLAIDAASKAGEPSWSHTNGDVIGDRGSYSNPAVADLDADGDYDLFIGLPDGRLEYWRNDGNDTSPAWALVNSNFLGDFGDYSSPVFADMDSDGDFDAFVGYIGGYSDYFENTGDKTNPVFTRRYRTLGVGNYMTPAAFDYNNDGDIDLYYGRDNAVITKLKNDVSETGLDFRHYQIADVGRHSTVYLADIDNDGDYDAFVGAEDGNVIFYENKGGANADIFGAANPDFWDLGTVLFDVGSFSDPTLADIDNDGDLDLLIGRSDGQSDYYRNDGTALNAFWTFVPGFFTSDMGDNSAPALADLDGDGDLDLAVGNAAGFISYFENQGNAQSPSWVLSGSNLVGDVGSNAQPEFVDYDLDGDFDLAVGRSDGVILLFNNTGSAASFNFVAAANVLDDYYDYSTAGFADLDGDGDLDLATGSGDNGGWIAILENRNGPGTLQFSNRRTFWFDNVPRSFRASFADFDGDGDLDMVQGQEDGFINYYRNDGNAAKPEWTFVRNWFGDFGSHTSPMFADLDGDGPVDVLIGRSDDNVVRFYKNDVKSTGYDFQLNTSDLVGGVSSFAAPKFADMDADGDLDLLLGAFDGRVRYYRNDGNATNPLFAQQSDPIADQGQSTDLSVGDLDADGDLDIVLGTDNDQFVKYFRNDGNSTHFSFVSASPNLLGNNCRPGDGSVRCSPELVDLDNDGDLDLLVSVNSGLTRYWRNDGTPQIAVWADQGDIIGDIGSTALLGVGDLDGDGDVDLILGMDASMMRVFKNVGSPASPSYANLYSGPGGFSYVPTSDTHMHPELADLNGDGLLDVILGRNVGGTVEVFYNRGHWQTSADEGNNPTFYPADSDVFDSSCETSVNAGTGYCSGDFVDIDDDGDLDWIGTNYYGAPRWWENVGSPAAHAFVDRGALVPDFQDFVRPSLGDFDGDGDLDMVVGYGDGRTMFFKNVGDRENPSFTTVYRGDNGVNYLPNLGVWANVAAVDIDNDGKTDIAFTEDRNQGGAVHDFYFLRNYGILDTDRRKAANPTWIVEGTVLTNPTGRPYNKATLADADGDGDIDLVLGDDQNRLYYFRNEGTQGSPNFVYQQQITDLGSDWAKPAFIDYDGDGDFDLYSGQGSGHLNAFTNTGAYLRSTTVTLKDGLTNPIAGAQVTFSDGSGVVCANATNDRGQASCPITFVGSSGRVAVANSAPGTISFGIFSPNSRGKTFMTLNAPSPAFAVDLERFVFQTFDDGQNPKSMRIKVGDDGTTLFNEQSGDSGFLDGFFPRRYLENRQEPFSQNRIQYDIQLEQNEFYGSSLALNGVFAPNEVNFNSNTESGKLYKFLSAHQLSTDSRYKGFIIFPALTAQRQYELTDSVPADFSYAADATAAYLGNLCAVAAGGTELRINSSVSGCGFLNLPVEGSSEWLKYEFFVETPSLDFFIINGFDTKNYSFPSAELKLIS
ncbi:VCBS repeat-containing protein [Candidatus Woesearchaeota archaeon]|nr:VCBS repeat-containing protein [Candidatus Woesearchaeota archaeon]